VALEAVGLNYLSGLIWAEWVLALAHWAAGGALGVCPPSGVEVQFTGRPRSQLNLDNVLVGKVSGQKCPSTQVAMLALPLAAALRHRLHLQALQMCTVVMLDLVGNSRRESLVLTPLDGGGIEIGVTFLVVSAAHDCLVLSQ